MMAYVASESAAQAHMTMLQGIVQRMAANSASCKTWCITIVSAVVVAVADKGNANLLWIAALPIPAFFMLDVYYLGLERGFRESYNKRFAEHKTAQAFRADSLSVGRHEVTTGESPAGPWPAKCHMVVDDATVVRGSARVGGAAHLVARPRIRVFQHANTSMFSGALAGRRESFQRSQSQSTVNPAHTELRIMPTWLTCEMAQEHD